jgi:hypothetical protein
MTSTHLSRHFEQLRLERGLRPGQLAVLAGCSNPSKNGGRIRQFETTGKISRELLTKLIVALEVDRAVVVRLIETDQREYHERWLAWVNTPIRPYFVVRIMAAIYNEMALPRGLTQEEAETHTSNFAKKHSLMCCLVWSRRLSVWFDRDGVVYDRTEAVPGKINTPYSWFGNKSFIFSGDFTKPISIDAPPKKVGPFEKEEPA